MTEALTTGTPFARVVNKAGVVTNATSDSIQSVSVSGHVVLISEQGANFTKS